MKTVLVCSLLAISMFATAALGQTPAGFTTTTAPFDQIQANGTTQHGVIVRFVTSDPEVTAFYAEVAYRLPGKMGFTWTQVFCLKRFSGDGFSILLVGEVAESAAQGWEIKTWGRRSATDPAPHY